jgi:hypothetical protein
VSPKELTAFRIDPEVMDGLRRVKDRDGIPLSIQVDRALRTWLERKDITLKKRSTASERARRPRRHI